ncbi:MAG TPA: hypothetical protein VHE54_13105 [Puia sp.]|nr:hypothetical protein [Puia sp.]
MWASRTREACDRGNGALILLYNPSEGTVILKHEQEENHVVTVPAIEGADVANNGYI